MAVTSVVERLCGILGNALFTPLYGATLLTFRGAVYMCFAALTSIGTAFIVLVGPDSRLGGPFLFFSDYFKSF